VLLSKARIFENSEQQAKSIEERLASTNIQDEEANFVNPPRPKGQQRRQQRRNCGLSWPHRDAPCPAKGQTCQKCNKQNHYAEQVGNLSEHARGQNDPRNWVEYTKRVFTKRHNCVNIAKCLVQNKLLFYVENGHDLN
jgi:hypothetical protein